MSAQQSLLDAKRTCRGIAKATSMTLTSHRTENVGMFLAISPASQ